MAPPTNPYLAYKTSPDDDPSLYPNAYRREIVASFNPLSRRHFGNVFFDLNGCGDFHRANYFYTDLLWWARGRGDVEKGKSQEELDRRQKAFTRSGASWRRMLVAQPAQPALGFVWVNTDSWESIHKGYIDTVTTESGSCPILETRLQFGLLYGLVQYHTSHHDYSLWFRVVWGRPFGYEFMSDSGETTAELLRETSVIVQFHHINEPREKEPTDVEAFDREFRCADFRLPDGKVVEVSRRPW
ncbi:hypothetical protein BDV06DRAFT_179233 [Aspergillus oleicola]